MLAEIRRLIDRQLRHPDALDDGEREAAGAGRGRPTGLRALGDADVPDGARLAVRRTGWHTRPNHPGQQRPRHRLLEHARSARFAAAVGGLGLGPDVLVGGSAFVFTRHARRHGARRPARDGCRGAGRHRRGRRCCWDRRRGRRHACSAELSGRWPCSLLLRAFGLKVNFLDFMALPITIGIGIDYSVNIISRARAEANTPEGRVESARTASAVALCSYTTVVGIRFAVVLSNNKGMRSFGSPRCWESSPV